MGSELFPTLMKVVFACVILLVGLAVFSVAESSMDSSSMNRRTVVELKDDEERMLRDIRQRLAERQTLRSRMAQAKSDIKMERETRKRVRKVFGELERSVYDMR